MIVIIIMPYCSDFGMVWSQLACKILMKATWTASEHGLSFLAYNGDIIMAFWPGIDISKISHYNISTSSMHMCLFVHNHV